MGIETSPVIFEKQVTTGNNLTVGEGTRVRKDVVIGNDVSIGAEVFIDKGCVIGDGAVAAFRESIKETNEDKKYFCP